MKKTLLAIALFVGIGLLNSCKKQETIEGLVTTTKKTRAVDADVYKTSYGFLKFRNREVFDKILEQMSSFTEDELTQWEKGLGFVSLKTKMQSNSTQGENYNKLCEDNLLLTLLDNDGMIQVGEHVFKAETDLGLCWTLNAGSLSSDLQNLKSRTFSATTMNRVNTNFEEEKDADIYEFLDAGNVGVFQQKTRGIFGSDHKPAPVDDCSEGGICNRGDAKASYQNAVFYKSLYTELKTYKKGGGIWTPLSTDINRVNWTLGSSNCQYKKKGGSLTSIIYSPTATNYNYGYHHDWRPYSGSKKLDKYKINGNFKFYCPATGNWREHHAGVYNF